MAHNEAHNALVRDALQELAIAGYTAWRNETGVWFEYFIKNGKLVKGRPHKYGKVGSGDIMGVLPRKFWIPSGSGSIQITIGQHFEAEAKTGVGNQSENQNIHETHCVNANGGIYILFRSTRELLSELSQLK